MKSSIFKFREAMSKCIALADKLEPFSDDWVKQFNMALILNDAVIITKRRLQLDFNHKSRGKK